MCDWFLLLYGHYREKQWCLCKSLQVVVRCVPLSSLLAFSNFGTSKKKRRTNKDQEEEKKSRGVKNRITKSIKMRYSNRVGC